MAAGWRDLTLAECFARGVGGAAARETNVSRGVGGAAARETNVSRGVGGAAAPGTNKLRRRWLLHGLVLGIAVLGAIPVIVTGRWAEAEQPRWIARAVNGMRDDVLLPAHHDPARRYPVVLYLRQPDMGNSSDRLRRQAGAWFGTEVFRFRHSCIVMMPMLEQRHDPGGVEINVGGKGPHRSGEHNLAAALRQVVDCYLVDLDQFHVTEPSTDGMGSWQMPPD